MACVHLKQLYKLCQENELKLAGTDLIRIVCQQCGVQEVCPSNMIDMDAPDEAGVGVGRDKDRNMQSQ